MILVLVVATPAGILQAQTARPVVGEPTLGSVEHGKFWQYMPRSAKPTSPVLVIAHGMLTGTETGETFALGFLKVWIEFSNSTGAVLVAPAFDNENFGGGDGCPHGWGYRGLYGRHVGADEFLHEILDSLQKANPKFDGRVFLWGHSAGGQFVSHYVVRHPQRVHSAVVSAAAWLPFPTMEDNWPRGMKPRKSVRRWPGESEDQVADVTPDPKSFLAAAELPLLVTSGSLDTEEIKHSPSQGGDTHVARAESWSKAMNAYAKENGGTGKVECVIVPKIDHSGGKMARAIMPWLANQMKNQVSKKPASKIIKK